ncbi:MAG TPA: NAD-glutamate dehydrogenase [Steroidobacteraceae bacterium]|nr:NAD-glutamate dehydrogenase [Steroidobacteraceae bacterium]
MSQITSEPREQSLQAICTAGGKSPLAAVNAEAYLRAYYANVDPEDLAARAPAELAAAAFSHLRFAAARGRARPALRVFNPTAREHGYAPAHTVIEMVGEDMPFLVDSIGLAFQRRGMTMHFLAHPIFAVARDARGVLKALHARTGRGGRATRLESFQHVEIDRIVDPATLVSLAREIECNLDDVRVACADWHKMRAAARETAQELQTPRVRGDRRDTEETRALLEWMADRHFTFLGFREYRLKGSAGHEALVPLEATGLGILRRGHRHGARGSRALPGDVRRESRRREVALVTKSNIQSTVHRAGFLDYVGIKRFDATGRLIGERRFLGLWTSTAYNANPRDIPLVRHKVHRVVAHFALAPDSHDGKALQHILEAFPRDELFQASVAELVRVAAGIFGLQERPRVRLLLRPDPFRRFYSCLVFVPREKYNTQVRQRIERVLRAALDAFHLESQVAITQSNLARIHVVARTQPSEARRVHVGALERGIEAAVRSWSDGFKTALLARLDETHALELFERYAAAFPAAYTEDFAGEAAAVDVSFLEALERDPAKLQLETYRADPRRKERVFLKIYRNQDAIPISDLLPMLENMGLRVIAERPYQLDYPRDRHGWIQDLELEIPAVVQSRFEARAAELKNTFTAVWSGHMDNDGLNRLTLHAGVPWRIVNAMRAYCRYLLQAGLPYSQGYIAQVLIQNAGAARLLADLFVARFDTAISPAARRASHKRLSTALGSALDDVRRSDEDRILRALWNAIAATVRTNAYQRDDSGNFKQYLSFKVESRLLRELPLPKPLYEIFVFSPRMEGVHLRMGRVARGGIRWSDRLEDFRTEILGLMKAQNVKNTMIVPVGAKGGFVARRLPDGEREAQAAEVVACYRTLIHGLLDLTDNIVEERIVPPQAVVRHDGDDPYLVVAADKGTATFSDIANEISAQYRFWLGDAFASGGSVGYDHKKMAITARGAWECVKRHFRETGVDIQRREFTVAGIGDMAGDVFGNGMLQSPHIRLLAAFNHQHVFIDPAPDAARSFRERMRLYKLPRSGWDDYARDAISTGGAVHLRSAKSLSLSREAQALLGLPPQTTPNEAIKAILKLPVDLLWNGGVGTFVKASHESQSDVGDRSNDAVRVDARDLRCKVVGEGGNLGLSQAARIEYARRGGRLNTDFIDNSAGVNCSDVEVNLKILLNGAVHARELSQPARNRLLVQMTDAVAGLVLRNNYLQSQAISVLEYQARERLSENAFMLRALERSGDLNRLLESLPSDEEIAERRKSGEGLTRPEIAIALSYGKIWLDKALIDSDVPEDDYLADELLRYFPSPVRLRFAARIERHRLRREIIATAVTNSLINRMGPVFAVRAVGDTAADPAAIARAYTIAREVFCAREIWEQIESLDNRVAAAVQYDALERTTRILRHMSYWLLENRRADLDIERGVRRYSAGVAQLTRDLHSVLGAGERARYDSVKMRLVGERVPEALAARIAALDALHGGLDLVEVSLSCRVSVGFAAQAYFALGERIGLAWIKEQIEALIMDGHWHAIARRTLRDTLYALQRRITSAALAAVKGSAATRVETWIAGRRSEVAYLDGLIADLRSSVSADFATLSVAVQSVRRLARA